MKIKYVVRTTTYCVDGTHTTQWADFGGNLEAARAFEARERERKLLLCDVRRDVRRLTVAA